ncbi:MAG: AAA family ATPase [Candidatus Marinimicrobia bacterium]|nr:AAA family ATPase [Candidatus Neomarinimicrobiota bacterium]
MPELTGRKTEKQILLNALHSKRSELVVVYGRRRIGKTFLVREVYKNKINIELIGVRKASLKDQLKNFHLKLSVKDKNVPMPLDWQEAFHYLEHYLNKVKSNKKKIIFIDEFPWLDTRKSKFLPAFEYFWNSYVSSKDDIVVVICGSAASYMIQKIINDRGGLHNRITEKIRLSPFNLFETENFFKSQKVKLTRFDIVQVYMALGGIPFYLEKVLPGESVPQMLDRLCFSTNGFLRTEFSNVFTALFDQHDNHEKIIRQLAIVKKGLTRKEILKKSKTNTGGRLTKTLKELEESGFIEKYSPYSGKKNSLYRLSDEYSMFYLKYIENTKPSNAGIWMKLQAQQSYKIWSGFTFETICIKHVEQIKEALKITGIETKHGSWLDKKSSKQGAQIDLIIDRSDNVINLCEMKFYNTTYTIDKKYANEIVNKQNAFINSSKTQKSVFITFITSYGLKNNKYKQQYVQNELTLTDLFIEL